MASEPFFNKQPLAVTALAGAIVIAHVLRVLALPYDQQEHLVDLLSVVPARWEQAFALGEYYSVLPSLFGHVFLHGGWIHLLFNMVLFVSVGRALSVRLAMGTSASFKFLIIFFVSAAAGALMYVAFNPGSQTGAIGASGAVCGIFSAYLMAARATWQDSLRDRAVLQTGAMFLAINVGLAWVASFAGILPIAWEAHLGGFIGGALVYPFLAPRVAAAPPA